MSECCWTIGPFFSICHCLSFVLVYVLVVELRFANDQVPRAEDQKLLRGISAKFLGGGCLPNHPLVKLLTAHVRESHKSHVFISSLSVQFGNTRIISNRQTSDWVGGSDLRQSFPWRGEIVNFPSLCCLAWNTCAGKSRRDHRTRKVRITKSLKSEQFTEFCVVRTQSRPCTRRCVASGVIQNESGFEQFLCGRKHLQQHLANSTPGQLHATLLSTPLLVRVEEKIAVD